MIQQKLAITLFTASLTLGFAQNLEVKMAEQQYKNITSFKGAPAEEVMPAMQFMATSLGVECAFCHVTGKMEADEKAAKKTAREMIAMTAAISHRISSTMMKPTPSQRELMSDKRDGRPRESGDPVITA